MYYTSEQLSSYDVFQHHNAYLTYLYLYRHKKDAFHTLCPHEKDFFFSKIEASLGNAELLDLYKEQEAYEYIFYSIIVTYKDYVLDFWSTEKNHLPQYPHRDTNKDVPFFIYYYRIWINQIDLRKGKYLLEISNCISKRIKEIQNQRLTQEEYDNIEKKCYLMFFCVYYKAKMYFEELGNNHVHFTCKEFHFIATTLTFCHILSRHYFPRFNDETKVSFNHNHLFDDSKYLLSNIQKLVLSYFEHTDKIQLNGSVGRLLFRKENENYIMWVKKRKKMCQLSNSEGYEISTFFRCDCNNTKYLAFYEDTKEIKLADGWLACI